MEAAAQRFSVLLPVELQDDQAFSVSPRRNFPEQLTSSSLEGPPSPYYCDELQKLANSLNSPWA